MKKIYFLAFFLLTFSVYMGCKKDNENENPTPEPPTYTNGEGEIGEVGGIIMVDDPNSNINGTQISIPENALGENVNISIIESNDGVILPEDTTAIVIKLEPEGLTFNEPVELIIPFDADNVVDTSLLAIYYIGEDNSVEQFPVEIDWNNKTVKGRINHFSHYTVTDKGVGAKIKYLYDGGQNKLYVNIKLEGFKDGNFLGFEGISVHSSYGYSNSKDLSLNFNNAGAGIKSQLKVKLKKKGLWKWSSPTIAEKTVMFERIFESYNGCVLKFYDYDHSQGVPKWVINDANETENILCVSGESAAVTFFDLTLDPNERYFIDIDWDFLQPWSNLPDFRTDISLNDFSRALKPIGMTDVIADDNYNMLLDKYESGNQPTAQFIIEPNSGTTQTNFKFDAGDSYKNTNYITRYYWDWDGNGIVDEIKTTPVVYHKFDQEGTYAVKLTVEDENNVPDSETHPVNVNNGSITPTADFTYSPSNGNTTTSFTFNASSSSINSKEFSWDFDNDGTWEIYKSTSKTATRKFTNPGTYEVKLEARSPENLADTKIKTIVVAEPGVMTVTNPNSSTIWIMGSQNIPINWTTGDNSGDVTLQLYKDDIKRVTLTSGTPNDGEYRVDVGTSWGESDKYQIKIILNSNETKYDFSDYFEVKETNNLPPDLPKDEYPIDQSTIDGLSETLFWTCQDPENDPLKYDIHFGANSNPPNVHSNSSENTYEVNNLQESTTYYWKIVAKDNNGNSTEGPIWSFSTQSSGSTPVADFSADITSGTAPLAVNFTDQSTNIPTSWLWDFGDGGTSTQPNPSHTFNNEGTYTVSLTATNQYGSNTKIETSFIIVNAGGAAPISNFSADITSGTAPLTVNFTDQSTNTPNSWQWDFGDGATSTQPNPSHTYNNEGSYTVTLTVSNEYGSDTKTINNYIYVGNGGGGEPCPGTPTVTDADGNVYNTVQIGGQCWMKENLRVGTRIDGSQEMTNNSTIEKYCYDNDPANCDIYGGLYQWNEMMQYTTQEGVQGICPSGWHLPTDGEWTIVTDYLGGENVAGEKMKSTSGWYNNGNGTNSSGFNALPGGYRYSSGSFYYLGRSGKWWSSSESSGTNAWTRYLGYDNDQVRRNNHYIKTYGFSVRCLKN